MRRFSLTFVLALVLAMAQSLAFAANKDLEVRDARVRLLPGDLPAAGYFRIQNRGSTAVVLVGAESPAYGEVMMHQSTRNGGTARMEHVGHLRLAPGASLEFAPGGYHLMLMQRRQPLAVGDEVTVTLVFKDGQRLPVAFRAVSATMEPEPDK